MRKFLFAAAVVPFFAAAALAQNASTSTPANTPPADQANPPMTQHATTPADAPSKGPSFISVPDTAMLSGNVVGLDVYNGQNNDIGKIQDIVLGPDSVGQRLHRLGRRIPRHGDALCRGRSGRRVDQV